MATHKPSSDALSNLKMGAIIIFSLTKHVIYKEFLQLGSKQALKQPIIIIICCGP